MLIVLVASVLLSILFAPLGSALTWQRKAYFSDGLVHACLLAASISGCLDISVTITAPIVAVLFALLIVIAKDMLADSAAINLISNTMLALGLLLASTFPSSTNINAMLFGDVLSVTKHDILILLFLVITVYLAYFYRMDDIVLFSLHPDLAAVRGMNIKRFEIYSLIILAVVLAVSMKIIGVLMVTALLMIPSYSAVLISKTPIQMICYSFIISVISSVIGIAISFYYDFVTSPSIILSCSIIYFLILSVKHKGVALYR